MSEENTMHQECRGIDSACNCIVCEDTRHAEKHECPVCLKYFEKVESVRRHMQQTKHGMPLVGASENIGRYF